MVNGINVKSVKMWIRYIPCISKTYWIGVVNWSRFIDMPGHLIDVTSLFGKYMKANSCPYTLFLFNPQLYYNRTHSLTHNGFNILSNQYSLTLHSNWLLRGHDCKSNYMLESDVFLLLFFWLHEVTDEDEPPWFMTLDLGFKNDPTTKAKEVLYIHTL